MTAGRSADVVERNWEIYRLRYATLRGGRLLPISIICDLMGLSRKTVSAVLNAPQSLDETERRARPTVSLRGAPDGRLDGISHGSDSGYRRCRQRPEGACVPCLNAHALVNRRY